MKDLALAVYVYQCPIGLLGHYLTCLRRRRVRDYQRFSFSVERMVSQFEFGRR